MRVAGCPLCDDAGGQLIIGRRDYRIVRVREEGFPAFYRVIWNDHVAELSDLAAPQRGLCMDAVVAVEQALRGQLRPTKVNVASLGNMVPHLHWHVIARFGWDSHFPAPVWSASQRAAPAPELARIEALLGAVDAAIADAAP